MNNHKDMLGIIFNIVLVLIILSIIVVGLNKIGVYDLPDSIEKFLGTYVEPQEESVSNVKDIVDSIDYDSTDSYIVPNDITYENARALLKNVVPLNNYSHDMLVQYFHDGNLDYTEKITVKRSKGFYTAVVTTEDDYTLKTIVEDADNVIVTMNSDESVVYQKGEFDISDECGFILTADNFVNSDYVLGDAEFSVSKGIYGGEISITFNSTIDGYSQMEQYVVSLDYGVVISADAYENDVLVYSMKTNTIGVNK